jgi:dienelactone hydrolase
MPRLLPALAALLILAPAASAQVVTETVRYEQGGTALEGYLAYNAGYAEAEGPLPAVVIVHEWTGLGDYVKERAEMLARLGYVAFAADIYGVGVRPDGPQQAQEVSGRFYQDPALLRARAAAAVDQVRSYGFVDGENVAAIGYCFGGTTVLELARSGAPLAGVVSFHGGLQNLAPQTPARIDDGVEVLVLHGTDDPFAPLEQVTAFVEEMRAGGVDYDVKLYGGAVHSFTNPEATGEMEGAQYDPEADVESWEDMQQFFARIFQ